jgi:ATP-dependent protease ClpP protease subunit
MKHHPLSFAIGAALFAPQAAPRTPVDRPRIEPIMRLSPSAAAANTYELLIYGDIGESWWGESVTAQNVAQQLNDLPDTVATINVRVNSYGGSVADGLAIYNALTRHKATKAVTVDGVAMSSASLIAMAGDTVTMPPTSLLMIHAPWGGLYGNAKEMRQYADVLDKFSEAMADAYVAKSKMARADVLALLTDGEDHYYTGEEAVAAGFADAIADAAEEEDQAASLGDDARAFAAAMFDRIAARCPKRYAGLAIDAALRASHTPPPTKTPAQGAESRSLAPAVGEHEPPAASAVQTPPAAAGTTTEEPPMPDANKQAITEALAADKQRRSSIRSQFEPFTARADLDQAALAKLQRECEDDSDATVESSAAKLLAFLGKDATPSGNQRIEGGRDIGTESYREGAVAAVLHRANPQANKLDEKSKEFRGMTLVDLARDCAERAGCRTRGLSRAEVAIKAMQSTSDFPSILENIITKTLRAGYAGTSRTFVPWTRQATLPDFKEISRTQLSGAPNLKRVLEGAEYEFGTMGDGAEKYRVHKYGRIVAVTWETVINDDLNALVRLPQAFGASAGDLESDIVYGIVNSNAALADGVALFHNTHGNLGTAAALIDAINPDPSVANPLAEMRKLMLLQKGLEGRYITVRPRYLIVPPGLEEAALKVTNAAIVAARGNDANVIGPSLIPIVEPRLHDNDDNAWYGAAEPSMVDTLEYAYLEGHEGVFTETKQGFEVDGVQVKCRHVFGAKAIDHRGLFKNAGGTPAAYPVGA